MNKLVRKALYEGKTYAEIGIVRNRRDWRVILYFLMKHGVMDSYKTLELLPADSKVKANEKWNAEKYFVPALKNAWAIAKKHVQIKEELHHRREDFGNQSRGSRNDFRDNPQEVQDKDVLPNY